LYNKHLHTKQFQGSILYLSHVVRLNTLHNLRHHLQKGAYGGTNSVILVQLFSHVCDSMYGINCTFRDKNIRCRCPRQNSFVHVDPD